MAKDYNEMTTDGERWADLLESVGYGKEGGLKFSEISEDKLKEFGLDKERYDRVNGFDSKAKADFFERIDDVMEFKKHEKMENAEKIGTLIHSMGKDGDFTKATNRELTRHGLDRDEFERIQREDMVRDDSFVSKVKDTREKLIRQDENNAILASTSAAFEARRNMMAEQGRDVPSSMPKNVEELRDFASRCVVQKMKDDARAEGTPEEILTEKEMSKEDKALYRFLTTPTTEPAYQGYRKIFDELKDDALDDNAEVLEKAGQTKDANQTTGQKDGETNENEDQKEGTFEPDQKRKTKYPEGAETELQALEVYRSFWAKEQNEERGIDPNKNDKFNRKGKIKKDKSGAQYMSIKMNPLSRPTKVYASGQVDFGRPTSYESVKNAIAMKLEMGEDVQVLSGSKWFKDKVERALQEEVLNCKDEKRRALAEKSLTAMRKAKDKEMAAEFAAKYNYGGPLAKHKVRAKLSTYGIKMTDEDIHNAGGVSKYLEQFIAGSGAVDKDGKPVKSFSERDYEFINGEIEKTAANSFAGNSNNGQSTETQSTENQGDGNQGAETQANDEKLEEILKEQEKKRAKEVNEILNEDESGKNKLKVLAAAYKDSLVVADGSDKNYKGVEAPLNDKDVKKLDSIILKNPDFRKAVEEIAKKDGHSDIVKKHLKDLEPKEKEQTKEENKEDDKPKLPDDPEKLKTLANEYKHALQDRAVGKEVKMDADVLAMCDEMVGKKRLNEGRAFEEAVHNELTGSNGAKYSHARDEFKRIQKENAPDAPVYEKEADKEKGKGGFAAIKDKIAKFAADRATNLEGKANRETINTMDGAEKSKADKYNKQAEFARRIANKLNQGNSK